jgi:hypothetical protein
MSHNANVINTVEPDTTGNYTIATNEFIFAGRGLSQDYSTSPSVNSWTSGRRLHFYDTNILNNISGATINSTSNWVNYVTLPAGRYKMSAYFSAIFSASGSFEYTWRYLSSTYIGNDAIIGAQVNSTLDGARIATASVDITSSQSFEVIMFSQSNTTLPHSQGNVPAEESWMWIERLY